MMLSNLKKIPQKLSLITIIKKVKTISNLRISQKQVLVLATFILININIKALLL